MTGRVALAGVQECQSMIARRTLLAGGAVSALAALALLERQSFAKGPPARAKPYPVTHTDAEWRKLLTPAQYQVLRQAGTEAPESSPLDHQFAKGIYACAGCGQPNYLSSTKFESGTGWPSFWKPIDGAVSTSNDTSLMMDRTEVHCSRCGGHLGHVFDDGPQPTGLRYCMNGVALTFKPA
jgi:peptide-methionine (R)-S-oxide reductase